MGRREWQRVGGCGVGDCKAAVRRRLPRRACGHRPSSVQWRAAIAARQGLTILSVKALGVVGCRACSCVALCEKCFGGGLASGREANGRRIWRAKPVRGCVRQHNICRRSVCALRAPGDSGAPIRARLSRPPHPVARLAMLWCIPVTRRSRVILSKIHADTCVRGGLRCPNLNPAKPAAISTARLTRRARCCAPEVGLFSQFFILVNGQQSICCACSVRV